MPDGLTYVRPKDTATLCHFDRSSYPGFDEQLNRWQTSGRLPTEWIRTGLTMRTVEETGPLTDHLITNTFSHVVSQKFREVCRSALHSEPDNWVSVTLNREDDGKIENYWLAEFPWVPDEFIDTEKSTFDPVRTVAGRSVGGGVRKLRLRDVESLPDGLYFFPGRQIGLLATRKVVEVLNSAGLSGIEFEN